MNKKELINELWQNLSDFRKKDLELILDLLFNRLAQALKEGQRIEIRGFGRFLVKEQRPRRFKNPRTGEERQIPSRRRIIFKPGKDLLERLNASALASVDLGTQTFRVLLAKPAENSFRPLLRRRYNVRLGEGLSRSGEISPEAFERGLKALLEIKELFTRTGVQDVLAAGTAVFRKAKNAKLFLEKAREKAGFEIKVLTPEEEAGFTLKGINYGFPLDPSAPILIIDAGGGSTEYILGQGGEVLTWGSLDLGVVTATEKFLPPDSPPDQESLSALWDEIKEKLAPIQHLPTPPTTLIATGGTASCLAALKLELENYCLEKLHGTEIKKAELEEIYEKMRRLAPYERRALKGMEPGREDIILVGTMLYLALLEMLGLKAFKVSETGILEGLLLHLMESSPNISAKI